MSWASTQDYYRLINQKIQAHRGRQNSAEILISSVNFQEIIDFQVKNQWGLAGNLLAAKAKNLEQAGASAFLIASNTMHKTLTDILKHVKMPVLNIFDGTSNSIREKNFKHVGLLGTRYTMNDPFFKAEYAKRGISTITPNMADATKINEIIFKELIHGIVKDESRVALRTISQRLVDEGAEGVILGCTELPLLVELKKESVHYFDTTEIHADMAVKWLISR